MPRNAVIESEVDLLEVLAGHLGLEFDPALVRQALNADPGDPTDGTFQGRYRALERAGRDLGMRFTLKRGTAKEAVALAHPSAPVVGLGMEVVAGGDDGNGEAGNGALPGVEGAAGNHAGMVVLLDRRGRKVKVETPGSGEPPRWLTTSEVVRMLGLARPDAAALWAVATSIAPCNPAVGGNGALRHRAGQGGHPERHGELPPLRRLLRFLGPDAVDIRVVLLFAVAVGILSLATPLAVEALVTTIAFNRLYQQLLVLSLFLLSCLGLSAAMRAMQTYVVEIIQQRLFVRLVSDLSHRLPRARFDVHDASSGPELVNRFFEVVTIQKIVAQLLLDGVALVLVTLTSLTLLAFYHPFLLGFDLVFLSLLVIFVFLLGRGAVTTSIEESRAKYAVAGWLEEIPRLPVSFAAEAGRELAAERADALARTYIKMRKSHFRIVFRQILFALALQAIASSVLLGLGGWLVMVGQLSLGQLVAAELMVTTIATSFAKLGKHIEGFYDLMAAMDKVGILLDLPLEQSGTESPDLRGAPVLEIIELAYEYPADHHPHHHVFRGLTLKLQPGDRLAVTGPPASGKSTFVQLLAALRRPTEGRIEWNQIDLHDFRLDELRDRIGLVQGTEIFDGTILENIRAGKHEISLYQVRQALEEVGLLDEILHLPQGLHTRLTYSGSPLSATQQVRLVLARAIAGRPSLLIVDALLDILPAAQRQTVAEALLNRQAPWTLVIVTQHAEVIEACDQELRFGEGEPKMIQNQLARWPLAR